MNDLAQKLRAHALWLALPVVALVAFGLGRCGADEPDESPPGDGDLAADTGTATIWTCSMHPQIRMSEPGQCPICGMDLVPVRTSDDEGGARDRITLSERAKALARIRTTPVVRAGGSEGSNERRLLGRVTADESTLRDVTAWISGRVDRLHVDVTGAKVRRGQVVATLFSPEVYAAHQDLLVAKRQAERLGAGTETARRAASAALESSRQRLRLLGVPAAELLRMEAATAPTQSVAIRSPFAGTVVERGVTEGRYVTTGAVLYRLADLSRVWVQLDAYESDLPLLREGQPVAITVEALPGVTIDGRVAFVDPVIDPMRRTARVRVEVDSRDGALRPGMFAEALLTASRPADATGPLPLVVPASAVLYTGRRSLVYVEVAGADRPTYEARPVRLGPRAGSVYPVLEGLQEGARVVTEGAFALDADLQLRDGTSMMQMPDDGGPVVAAVEMDDSLRATLAPLFESYLRVSDALAADDLGAAKAAATDVSRAATRVTPTEGAAQAAWSLVEPHFAAHGERIANGRSIAVARDEYEHLSTAVLQLLRVFGNPLASDVRVAHCPMVDDYRGADWVQGSATLRNPYFGAEMLTCGDFEATVAPDARLGGGPEASGGPTTGAVEETAGPTTTNRPSMRAAPPTTTMSAPTTTMSAPATTMSAPATTTTMTAAAVDHSAHTGHAGHAGATP